MKNKPFFKRHLFAFLAIFSGALLLTFTACDKDDDDDDMDDTYTISGNASGAQEVPAVSTGANGTISGTYNARTNTLNYSISWTGLSGIASDAHFHGPAAAGVSAGVLVPITVTTNGVNGSAAATITVNDAFEDALLDGKVYYNIHTVANPNGEIRGQISTSLN
jgi:hypothetical protein